LPRPSRGRRRHMVQFKMTLFLLYLKKKNVWNDVVFPKTCGFI
jgi:hypothetical protein